MLKNNSPINSPPVRQLQNHLRTDDNMKRNFIDTNVSSSEEEEDDNKSQPMLHKSGRTRTKYQEKTTILSELIHQQKLYLKSQRKIYKLKNQIDVEEVRTRYLKLELNNAQVLEKEKGEECKHLFKNLTKVRVENWIMRGLVLVLSVGWGYTLYSSYSSFYSSSS